MKYYEINLLIKVSRNKQIIKGGLLQLLLKRVSMHVFAFMTLVLLLTLVLDYSRGWYLAL